VPELPGRPPTGAPDVPTTPGSPAPLQRSAGLVVAVDGPSGSGKSTLARAVATSAGLAYLDTGAMYRAVTWAALDHGLDLADTAAVAALSRGLDIDVTTDPAATAVRVAGVDVTEAIRRPGLSAVVSAVATNLEVRTELVARQRAVAARGGVVLEGRDTTTVVAPAADVRILLTADEATRLARRAREVRGSDDEAALAATHAEVLDRDVRDSAVADFTTAADGVTVIDSSGHTAAQVLAIALELVRRAGRPVRDPQVTR